MTILTSFDHVRKMGFEDQVVYWKGRLIYAIGNNSVDSVVRHMLDAAYDSGYDKGFTIGEDVGKTETAKRWTARMKKEKIGMKGKSKKGKSGTAKKRYVKGR